jgi:hypothetical protein
MRTTEPHKLTPSSISFLFTFAVTEWLNLITHPLLPHISSKLDTLYNWLHTGTSSSIFKSYLSTMCRPMLAGSSFLRESWVRFFLCNRISSSCFDKIILVGFLNVDLSPILEFSKLTIVILTFAFQITFNPTSKTGSSFIYTLYTPQDWRLYMYKVL